MKLSTYVNFRGKCKEALDFYEKHLGGKISLIRPSIRCPNQR